MRLLIAHGDAQARLALKRVVADDADLETIESGEGTETLELLLASDSPAVAVVDWDLPGLDGLELCRLVRDYHEAGPPYVILLARNGREVATALDAGAGDCVQTPVESAELRARIDAGRRFAELPWERLAVAAERAHDARAALSAQRSLDGDDPDCDGETLGEAKFELKSVLVSN
jgi:DNA-binding response OmpR family regulator